MSSGEIGFVDSGRVGLLNVLDGIEGLQMDLLKLFIALIFGIVFMSMRFKLIIIL